jgi:aminopeptidase N
MAHDSDPFARWEAGQEYATKLILDRVETLQQGGERPFDEAFTAAIGEILRSEGLDKAFVAEAVSLPSEAFVAEQMTPVDVEGIHQAREALRRAIARAWRQDLERLYEQNRSDAGYSPDAAAAGRRSLKNVALSYLASLAGDDSEALGRIVAQYHESNNMTDRMAALRLLVDIPRPQRQRALNDFLARFQDDALVIDKWLTLQAVSTLPDTLAQVKGLLSHPDFSLQKPNKVRALVGSFTASNQLRYHAADGSGYAFHADVVLELDGINPTMAARLLTPLGRWQRFDEGRQAKMKGELARILAKPGLSSDVFEIASKSLE